MRTHNIYVHDKIIARKCSLKIVFLSYGKNFLGTEKRVRISHGKQAITFESLEFNCVSYR